jgi:hypothetical protein
MQGVHHDKPKENPLVIKTICLAMELYCFNRHAHRAVGGGDLRLRIHAGGDYPDHHRGWGDRRYTFISHRYTPDRQGVMVISTQLWSYNNKHTRERCSTHHYHFSRPSVNKTRSF